MSFDRFFQVLTGINPISEKFRNAIEKELIPLSLPKNHLLLEAPKVSDHVYFLQSGFAMSFAYVEGQKLVDRFWKPEQIIMSPKSFFEQVPSLEFIQLMESSEVLCINHKNVMQLLEEFSEANFIYRVVMNQYYEQSREKFMDMRQLTAEARHSKLTRTYSRLEQIISQEFIASYLGITPQSLSRIKRQRNNLKH